MKAQEKETFSFVMDLERSNTLSPKLKITFSNEEEFIRQMNMALNSVAYGKGAIKVKISNISTNSQAACYLLNLMSSQEKNILIDSIADVAAPVGFFNEEQESFLASILKNNKEDLSNKSRRLWWMVAGAAIGYYWDGLLFAVGGAALGVISALSREKYLRVASSYYSHDKVVNKITDSEQNALECGLQASNWKSYCASYSHLISESNSDCYRYPLAFAAGLREGMNGEEVIEEALRERKKSKVSA